MKQIGDETDTRIQAGDAFDKIAADSFPASDPPSWSLAPCAPHKQIRLAGAGAGHEYRLPTKPLGGVLPLRRFVRQDVHTGIDGLAVALFGAAAAASSDRWFRVGLRSLAALHGGVSAVSHCHLALAKLLPLEVHEAIDLGAGAFAVAFAFRKSAGRTARLLALLGGLGLIGASLVTDYRTRRGLPA